jgi:SAM-dependent methyltransferase
LNIGVGDGSLESEAQRLGMIVSTLDPNQRAIAAIRERLKLADRAQVGYANAIPFANAAFDAVVASEVFEHLTEDVLRGSLAEIRRVLAPGGTLLGTVPARERLADQLIVCPGCALRFHRWGHQQSFTCESMRALLGVYLQVDSICEKYFAPIDTLNWKGRILCRLKAALCKLGIHGSDENIVFRAHKTTSEPRSK